MDPLLIQDASWRPKTPHHPSLSTPEPPLPWPTRQSLWIWFESNRNGSFQNRPIEETNSQWTKTTLALFRRYFFPWSERGLSHDEPLHHAEAARGWHLRQRAHGPQHWVRRAGGHQEVSGLMLWRLWGVEPRPSMQCLDGRSYGAETKARDRIRYDLSVLVYMVRYSSLQGSGRLMVGFAHT